MAYFEQKIMSATAGGSTTDSTIISVVNGSIADSYINKAVTYDGVPSDLANPTVKLASAGEIVLGSILGISYGKLQIAVGGWDIKFYSSIATALPQGARIIGAQLSATQKGYVNVFSAAADLTSSFSSTEADGVVDGLEARHNGRGAVLHGGTIPAVAPDPGTVMVRVTMMFGG